MGAWFEAVVVMVTTEYSNDERVTILYHVKFEKWVKYNISDQDLASKQRGYAREVYDDMPDNTSLQI